MDANSYIPFELQIETMKRLPIKSLIRFRSVSKPWKSIIESSEFIADYNIHTHHYNHQQLLVGLYNSTCVHTFDDSDDDSFLEYQHNNKHTPGTGFFGQQNSRLSRNPCIKTSVIGYSQGLFAVYREYDYPRKEVVIWNPSIRKYFDIPGDHRFEWNHYNTVFGFGVFNATDPIILMIPVPMGTYIKPLHVELFQLSTGKWRSLPRQPRQSLEFHQKVVATDRFIYWVVNDTEANYLIVSFDMMNEEFTEISLPPSLARRCIGYILDLYKLNRESLAVVHTTRYTLYKTGYHVWMMEHNGLFKKLFTIQNPFLSTIRVLGFRKNGHPIIRMQNRLKELNLCVYEPDSELFKRIEMNRGLGFPCFAGSYMGTLLLLDRGAWIQEKWPTYTSILLLNKFSESKI